MSVPTGPGPRAPAWTILIAQHHVSLRVQSTQIEAHGPHIGFLCYTWNCNYGFGNILHVWVLGPSGIAEFFTLL